MTFDNISETVQDRDVCTCNGWLMENHMRPMKWHR